MRGIARQLLSPGYLLPRPIHCSTKAHGSQQLRGDNTAMQRSDENQEQIECTTAGRQLDRFKFGAETSRWVLDAKFGRSVSTLLRLVGICGELRWAGLLCSNWSLVTFDPPVCGPAFRGCHLTERIRRINWHGNGSQMAESVNSCRISSTWCNMALPRKFITSLINQIPKLPTISKEKGGIKINNLEHQIVFFHFFLKKKPFSCL